MEASLKGKKILVTGASRGIGRSVAERLVSLGAEVVSLSRGPPPPGCVRHLSVDLTSWQEVRTLVSEAGPFHGLVSSAGVARLGPFLSTPLEDFDQVFDVNVKALFNVTQVVAAQMVEAGIKGSIVTLSSQASQAALAEHAAYCASKGAIDSLNRVLALELGKHGIRANCVNPTVVMTDMGRIGWSDPNKAQSMLSKIPLSKFAEVDEVVDVVIFLLSEKSSMINGVTLPVDGGFLAC